MVRVQDVLVLSIASFLGNVGVALTGFGMAIVFLFVYQVVVLVGYDGDFRYAVFIQALSLFCVQPLLLKKAEFKKYGSWTVLRYFIPITIISTPFGQITGDFISTDMIESVAGFLVTFVAVFEIYQKRSFFAKFIRNRCCNGKDVQDTVLCHDEENPAISIKDTHHTSTTQMTSSSHEDDGRVFSKYQVDCSESSKNSSLDDSFAEEGENTTVKTSFFSIYDIGQTLGRGSFSVVKEGTRMKPDSRSFAIKIIEKASLLEEEEVRLKDEIAILQEINHDNILSLHEVYNEVEAYYMVFDRMTGGDLLTSLNKMTFFLEDETCRIAKSILDAVRYLHDRKIAHRDLKPENILFTSDDKNAQVKIADFGFARKEKDPGSFSTMCGTLSYVAPEILRGVPYGCKVDMWSFGVIVWVMLVGYQPFRGNSDKDLQNAITKGKLVFDEEFWKDVNDEAKEFISSLLVLDPAMRSSANEAQSHKWLSIEERKCDRRIHDTKVFFMIGSQRSGSNWLRTMLDEREDLAGPHPPHIMRDVMPIIEKFGDLSTDVNFRILVDHVCTFVERNQVPWTDRHGSDIKFLRPLVYAFALKSCMRVRSERLAVGNGTELSKKMYLLSIFDAIMTYYTKVNGKQTWICKSMGMSEHHDLLYEFYGPKRLRYIYLVRDPRDVAMSFMKTPVGDCHWYAIVTKWTRLQQYALRILHDFPDLVHKLHYESILDNKEKELNHLYEFIGERRFGGVKRQSSVLFLDETEDLINRAKDGREAQKARRLSYQFMNLGRGPSFQKQQNKKWLHPETGLKSEEIQIIESVAHETMKKLGYETHLVGNGTEPSAWSENDIDHFEHLNKEGISKMKESLAGENPDDLARRIHQASALNMVPVYQVATWEGRLQRSTAEVTFNEKMWKQIRSYLDFTRSSDICGAKQESLDDIIQESMSASIRNNLNANVLSERRHVSCEKSHVTKSGVRVRWASGTQNGYYPDSHDKPNQDRHACHVDMTSKGSVNWFGVYDGNGSSGHNCAEFAKNEIPKDFEKRVDSGESLLAAMESAYMKVHERLIGNTDIDTENSGTTATTLLLVDNKCILSHVGDSPAILGWQDEAQSVFARFLFSDHSPRRADERERIQRAGGIVMSVDQRDGIETISEVWETHEVPRVWSAENTKFPGCAFTRSIGNKIAHTIGVVARPEFSEHQISRKDRVLILASDGITEFLDAQTCVEIVCSHKDSAEAVQALIHEASERWMSRGDYMDDITAIVLFFDGNEECCSNTRLSNTVVGHEDISELIQSSVAPSSGESRPSPEQQDDDKKMPIGIAARAWTLLAGAASGFLGGLCGIRGPPLIFYFLHPPRPIKFDKKTQRATGSVITATNVAMRVAYYLVETFAMEGEVFFTLSDWPLYVCVIISSIGGVLVGSKAFDLMKDSRNNIRMILSIFLLLCGASLLISSFHF